MAQQQEGQRAGRRAGGAAAPLATACAVGQAGRVAAPAGRCGWGDVAALLAAPCKTACARHTRHLHHAAQAHLLSTPHRKLHPIVHLIFRCLFSCHAGVVGFDILKSLAPCPSASYWLRATAMVPVTLLTLLGVRCGLGCLRGVGLITKPLPLDKEKARFGHAAAPALLALLALDRLSWLSAPCPSPDRFCLLSKTRAQQAAGYEPLEGDVHWTPRSTLLYPALCTFAGLCAGTFGVGGGIVKVGGCWVGARWAAGCTVCAADWI